MLELLRSLVERVRGEERRQVGLDRLELDLLPDSVARELIVMMGLVEEKSREDVEERPPLILLALRA